MPFPLPRSNGLLTLNDVNAPPTPHTGLVQDLVIQPFAPAVQPAPAPGFPPPLPPQNALRPAPMIYRSIDGSGNNLLHTDYNATNTDFIRTTPAHFADGVSTPIMGANARDISNIVVAGQGATPNAEGLSGMMYAWGQFIDHDLDKMLGGTADISIATSASDIFGGAAIKLSRAAIDPATGAGTGKPALGINTITGWLDASMVYGSDATTAASLRLADGHMATSDGNNLPIVNGSFLAGDMRVAENPDLTALQVLFVREHNYQVDRLQQQHPEWTGDHLYQQAKAIVTAEIAHITYSEFLPHLLGPNLLTKYKGYNPNVNPTISEEFAGAAFRFGHSIVSAELISFAENGSELASQDLKDAFFEPANVFASTGDGADGLLRHLAADRSNALDVHIVDDMRNFLFSPGQGQDLAAINIQRGRDLGLGTLNQTREALGLAKYTSFEQLTSDATTAAALKQAYGSVDAIDLWTGGLAENHMTGAMIGETFGIIIAQQFEALRDGDRFWYENQGFDPGTLDKIENTSLSDLILRDTNTKVMQADAFVYTQRVSGVVDGIVAADLTVAMLVIGSATKDDVLIGGSNQDQLVAGAGHDRLDGGLGNDLLTGGTGPDVFVFSTKLGSNNIDQIIDFKPGRDKIELSHLIFQNLKVGPLQASAFQIGPQAQTHQAHILYDPNTGALFYDADGSGAIIGQKFALVSPGLHLTLNDFIVG
ncbi:MAG: peroxidase [Alphaproteobacteria bacterium]|nr:peroxidase [Alphaproteobacteria bacterium]